MKILLLTYAEHVPPKDISGIDLNEVFWKVEYDVYNTLLNLGHDVKVLGVHDNVKEVVHEVETFKPKIVFNLMDDFDDQSMLDQNVPSLIELLKVPYTGCNPRGLILSRDKALSKSLVKECGIKVPRFWPIQKDKYGNLSLVDKFPVIVKSRTEDASCGISQASVVKNSTDLVERIERVWHCVDTDAIVEEYISGQEIYVGVLGNEKLKALPVWELKFGNKNTENLPIATDRVKWNPSYRKKHRIKSGPAALPKDVKEELQEAALKIYKSLGLSGYARIDFRVTEQREIYFIEANANPHLAEDEDFAESAKCEGISYPELITKIIALGSKWERSSNPVSVGI